MRPTTAILLAAFTCPWHAPAEPPPSTPSPAFVITASKADDQHPPLSREQAASEAARAWDGLAASLRDQHKAEWEAKSISLGGKTMKFEFRTFGEAPPTGRSLFLSMHGGGGAPPDVNEQQWRNQIRLYEPAEGVYLAPRAPTDTWNLWHEGHIDAFFDRIILDAVLFEGVNPDRVYLMGYSAGGDGVYQLGPRMADRWAACAMMAGHPNEASPVNLRNVPFIINMGADDSAYNRNAVAAEWGRRLDELHAQDEQGYIHELHLRPGMGHWMKREDASAVPWMMQFTRNPAPDRVVWRQDDVTSGRLYWLAVPDPVERKPGATISVRRSGQDFLIEQVENVPRSDILLSDDLVNMDLPVRVMYGDTTLFEGTIHRTVEQIERSLDERPDRRMLSTGRLEISITPAPGASGGNIDHSTPAAGDSTPQGSTQSSRQE